MIKHILNYLYFLLRAKGKASIKESNPLLFKAMSNNKFNCFDNIEKERKKLLKNKKYIHLTDYGTGSKVNSNRVRQISDIAKYSLKPVKQAQFIFRLVHYLSCKHVLEIGTSLGITSSYLASANSDANIVSLEGCSEQLKVAKQVFNNLNISNIQTVQGEFNNTLPTVLSKFEKLDFVFFDGNHSFDATKKYYEMCLPFAHSESVFVFDDIYLNSGMQRFWKMIIEKKEFTMSVNLFHLGIVFFNPNYSQATHMLRV